MRLSIDDVSLGKVVFNNTRKEEVRFFVNDIYLEIFLNI